MAIARRNPPRQLIHHSDPPRELGVQYACGDYRELAERHGLVTSMSRVGDCYDNAMKESFLSGGWATLKKELLHDRILATRDEARHAIFEYIEVFYNRQRLHSWLGHVRHVSPEEFEAAERAKEQTLRAAGVSTGSGQLQ